ncbi:MAG: YggS family pyridoxal phosphate-dependent enzyme [Clostridia bacterium]|nr:YggS family pyridoxal phosphate-dependent enzyme [Clostridia bacterium]
MSIRENLKQIRNEIASIQKKNGEVLIVAVTKTVDIDTAEAAITEGVTDVGENRVQELLLKYESLNQKAAFHLIGHLQTNKVKYIIGKCKLIHSVDSLKLLQEIERQCAKQNMPQDILIQVDIAMETTKFGATLDEVHEMIAENEKNSFVKIKGLMTMAPLTENEEEIRKVFKKLYEVYIDIKGKTFYNTCMELISMGMSNDYKIAIEEGANIVRIGSKIFK